MLWMCSYYFFWHSNEDSGPGTPGPRALGPGTLGSGTPGPVILRPKDLGPKTHDFKIRDPSTRDIRLRNQNQGPTTQNLSTWDLCVHKNFKIFNFTFLNFWNWKFNFKKISSHLAYYSMYYSMYSACIQLQNETLKSNKSLRSKRDNT